MSKRLLDLLLCVLLLAIVLVPCLVVMLILRFTGEGKVFYRQERIGRGARPFHMLKFATMLEDSPNIGTGTVTTRNDPRVLPVGRVLRKTKINELPQLVNVLRGDMSFVGWRPLLADGFAQYGAEVQQKLAQIRPGLTGIGSLVFRDEEAILTDAADEGLSPHDCHREEIGPYKGALEAWYCDHRSFQLDLRVLGATAWCVLRPRSRAWLHWFRDLPEPKAARIRAHLGFGPSA